MKFDPTLLMTTLLKRPNVYDPLITVQMGSTVVVKAFINSDKSLLQNNYDHILKERPADRSFL